MFLSFARTGSEPLTGFVSSPAAGNVLIHEFADRRIHRAPNLLRRFSSYHLDCFDEDPCSACARVLSPLGSAAERDRCLFVSVVALGAGVGVSEGSGCADAA